VVLRPGLHHWTLPCISSSPFVVKCALHHKRRRRAAARSILINISGSTDSNLQLSTSLGILVETPYPLTYFSMWVRYGNKIWLFPYGSRERLVGLEGLCASGIWFSCIRDLLHTMRTSVAQKSVACIRQNGLSVCAHWCPKIPLRASVSEWTLRAFVFKSLGPFEEEEEGTGVASDVVKVQGENPATPGPLTSGMTPGP